MKPDEARRLTDLERVLADVVRNKEPSSLDDRDAAALAAVDPRRLNIYRKLVRGTVRDAIALQCPRSADRLGRSALDAWVGRFCESVLPRSQILRDVAFEFCAWAAPEWQKDARLPACLSDLARYELFEFDVYTARREAGGRPNGDALDAAMGVAFDGTARIARFGCAPHLGVGDPEPRPVSLFAYRDQAGELVTLELGRSATKLMVSLLVDRQPLGLSVEGTSLAEGEPLDRALIDATAQLLADLSERGVLLGPCPPEPLAEPPSPFFAWLVGPRTTY
jgi:hypothetical protein